MSGIVFVVTADNHLGKGAHLYPERLDEQEAVWRETLELARDIGAAGVLHAGDLFDRRRPSPDELLAAERPLVSHHAEGGPPVHVIPGNHDPTCFGPGGLDVLAEANLITLYRNPTIVDLPGMVLAALPWTSARHVIADHGHRHGVDDTVADLLVKVAGEMFAHSTAMVRAGSSPRVLLGHWSLTGAHLPNGLPVEQLREPVLPTDEIEALGFSALAFGHIHRGDMVGARSFYTGSPMPLDHGDTALAHGVWTLHVEPGVGVLPDTRQRLAPGVSLEAHVIDSAPFITIGLDDVRHRHVDGAIVRVRDTIAGAAVPVFDAAAVRDHLLERGAKRVDLAVAYEREHLPRTAEVNTDREPLHLLADYLAERGVDDDRTARLVELADPYLAGERAQVPA